MVTYDMAMGFHSMPGCVKIFINRVMVTPRTKEGCLVKSDSFLTVNPVCLYRLILTPTGAVYYHVKWTMYIKGEGQIPQWFSINLPTFFRTAAAGDTLSLLKLEYFSHCAPFYCWVILSGILTLITKKEKWRIEHSPLFLMKATIVPYIS